MIRTKIVKVKKVEVAKMASNKEEVKLFGMVQSPFVTRVEIALKLKGVEYKYEEEKWGNFSDTLIKYNPIYKKVPVFVHNDKHLSESLVILEYIDETWKQNPILPSDPYKRALARLWSNFIDDKVITPLFHFFGRLIIDEITNHLQISHKMKGPRFEHRS
jgi:glutathione S-transferase